MISMKNYYFLFSIIWILDETFSEDGDNSTQYLSELRLGQTCLWNSFKCGNSQCIPKSQMCNGERNCKDGSDESLDLCKKARLGICSPPSSEHVDSFASCEDFKIISFQDAMGIKQHFVEELTLISINCHSGEQYQSLCLEGKWTPDISGCTSRFARQTTCPEISNPSNSTIKCFFNDEERDCKDPHIRGVTIRPQCDKNFVPNTEELICESNGQWNINWIKCSGCGRISDYQHPLMFPWVALIFDKESHTVICVGTIISPNIILTAARCFADRVQGTDPKEHFIGIVESKSLIGLGDSLQFYLVEKISLHENLDIAVIKLKKNIIFNSNVYPICFLEEPTHDSDLLDTSGETVKLTLSLSNANVARAMKLQFQNISKCWNDSKFNEIKNRTLCTMSIDLDSLETCKIAHTSLENGLYMGSGVFVKSKDDRYVLRGILSSVLNTKESCLEILTDVRYYREWILNHLNRKNELISTTQAPKTTVPPMMQNEKSTYVYNSLTISCTAGETNKEFLEGCLLPSQDLHHIEYEASCTDSVFKNYCNHTNERTPVPSRTELRYSCQPNYATYSGEKFNSICFKGKWLPSITQCSKICKPLNPENVQLTCKHGGQNVRCDGNLIVNTEVSADCLPEYKRNTPSWTGSMFCREDRKWSTSLLKCTPLCGRSVGSKQKKPVTEKNENSSDFPWHAVVYEKTKNYKVVCEATIISPEMLISAAHCFQNQSSDATYTVGVNISQTTPEYHNHNSTKFYEIEKLIFHESNNSNTKAHGNIILLILKTKITFNTQTSPVCLFDETDIQIPPGARLNIQSWTTTNKSISINNLKLLQLSYLSFDECSKISSIILESDKFCARLTTDTPIKLNGGGLVRRSSMDNLYYLVGPIEIKNHENDKIVFGTSVNRYLPWITDQLKEINKNSYKRNKYDFQ